MTLTVHRAASTAALADGLAELLCDPLDDPFATEVVAVPAKGVERWLAQRLSHRLGAGPGRDDGICAGVRFLNPHSLVALVLVGDAASDRVDAVVGRRLASLPADAAALGTPNNSPGRSCVRSMPP